MNTKQKTNWWIDLALFAGFITTFFLDQTGVDAHQWIGIFSGALAAYHLFRHRDWVGAVSKRFFAKISSQSHLYYALDALLLLGFILIGVTGLVISTWLNLALSNFSVWLNVHIIVSIATLVVMLLKLAFHWRWIVRTARKIWAAPVMTSPKNTVVQPANASSSSMGRREFLQVIGIVGAVSALAIVNVSKSLAETTVTDEEDTTTSSPSSSLSNSSCTVSCHKACSYPGHCNRYVDVNNNGRCDLGECI